MTPDELQALREKHTYLGDYCGFCVKDGGYPADYPCDVIKVLDKLDKATSYAKSLWNRYEGMWGLSKFPL
jgi:hypothetical protein